MGGGLGLFLLPEGRPLFLGFGAPASSVGGRATTASRSLAGQAGASATAAASRIGSASAVLSIASGLASGAWSGCGSSDINTSFLFFKFGPSLIWVEENREGHRRAARVDLVGQPKIAGLQGDGAPQLHQVPVVKPKPRKP